MYYPYLRGRRYELVMLRDMAPFIADNNINPIIEPVRKGVSELRNAVKELVKNGAEFVLIINPRVGEFKDISKKPIYNLVTELGDYKGLSLGYIVDAYTDKEQIKKKIDSNLSNNISIIHYGFADGESLSKALSGLANLKEHIFIDGYTSEKYHGFFKTTGVSQIMIRDGFKIRKNADYPETEYFSDLHGTYKAKKMNGFGDFLIVGEAYTRGGPAYAVAIHLSYLDEENVMYTRHFISDRTDSTADPQGKFLEALDKLKSEVTKKDSLIFPSDACQEYLHLHEISHYPGLGYVKKLSMQHHIELMADYLSKH